MDFVKVANSPEIPIIMSKIKYWDILRIAKVTFILKINITLGKMPRAGTRKAEITQIYEFW